MAARYWVGGTGTWDNTTTHWSATSGGAGGASVPTAADDVFFDGNSGTGTVTLLAGGSCFARSLDCTGYTGTMTFGASVTLNVGDASGGNCKFVSTMTLNFTSGVLWLKSTQASTTVVLTTAGKSLNSVQFSMGSTTILQLADNLTVTGAVTLTSGGFDTNGKTCTWGSFSSANANVRRLIMGASNITLTLAGAAWSTSNINNLTIDTNTAVINLTGANATFTGNWGGTTDGLKGASVVMTGGGNMQLISPGIIKNLTCTGTAVKTDNLLVTAFGVTGTLTLTGNSATNRLLFFSSGLGVARTVSAAVVSLTNVDVMDIAGSGAAAPWTGTSLGDAQGNSGITFTTPVDQHWVSANGGNWSNAANWTIRVPLPQDNVIFDGAFNSGQTVTTDMPRLGATMDWSNVSWTGTAPILSGATSTTSVWYGSFILKAGMTTGSVSGNAWQLRGRSTHDLNPQGVSVGPGLTIIAPGGTYNLRSNYTQSNNSGISSGTYYTNDFNVICISTFNVSGTANIYFGTSTFTNTSATTGTFNFTTSGVVSAEQATFIYLANNANARTFAGGGNKFGTLTYINSGLTGALTITGNNTFGTLNFSNSAAANILSFAAGSTNVIGTRNIFGTSGKLMTVNSTTPGTPAILISRGDWNVGANSTLGTGNTGLTVAASNEMNYLSLQDITGSKVGQGNMFFGMMR